MVPVHECGRSPSLVSIQTSPCCRSSPDGRSVGSAPARITVFPSDGLKPDSNVASPSIIKRAASIVPVTIEPPSIRVYSATQLLPSHVYGRSPSLVSTHTSPSCKSSPDGRSVGSTPARITVFPSDGLKPDSNIVSQSIIIRSEAILICSGDRLMELINSSPLTRRSISPYCIESSAAVSLEALRILDPPGNPA